MTVAAGFFRPRAVCAGALLCTLAASVSPTQAQTMQTALPPDTALPIHPPVPLTFLIFLTERPPNAPAPAPQPVTCPRHTKPRSDCTPASQR